MKDEIIHIGRLKVTVIPLGYGGIYQARTTVTWQEPDFVHSGRDLRMRTVSRSYVTHGEMPRQAIVKLLDKVADDGKNVL